jgi:hypothetical protein
MKQITLIIALASTLLFSCGTDGEDGQYYISVSNNACIMDYTDNNSCVPYGMSYNYYYGPCSNTGSKTYTFHYCSGSGWTGSYSVYINSGEDKKTFKDGADGADRYYDIDLDGDGLHSSYRGAENAKNEFSQKDFLGEFDTKAETIDKYVDMGNGYTMHITGRKIKAGEMVIDNPKYLKK